MIIEFLFFGRKIDYVFKVIFIFLGVEYIICEELLSEFVYSEFEESYIWYYCCGR